MRVLAFLLMFSVVYLPMDAGAVTSNSGTSKYFFNLFWEDEHWEAQDFQGYTQNSTAQHNLQWQDDGWEPSHWTGGEGGARAVIDGFFQAGLLVEQDETREGVPVLEVGESFLHLSSREKSRIARFMDYAYGVTGGMSGDGMYYLTYRDDGNIIGVYTKHGLQLH